MNLQSEAFAKNLKERRRELGYTQKELAELIGYSEKSVSKWESGAVIAPSAVLPLLAKKLGTSIDSLLSENSEQRYYLGIDGGGTKTAFALADSNGSVLYKTVIGGSNPVDIGIERTYEILTDGIETVCASIPYSKISVFAGISGGITGDYKARIRTFLENYGFASADNGSDAENAVAIALGRGEGTAVIMGTGSIAFSRYNGKLIRNGGYGYLFDDGGSGFAIGRDAVIAALNFEEGRGEQTVLLQKLKESLGTDKLLDSLGTLYKGGKRATASFAPIVFSAFKEGDAVAARIIDENMWAVARLIENAPRNTDGRVRAVLVGGLVKEFELLLPLIKRHLKDADKYDISASTRAPIYGALMLAGAENVKEI